MAISGCAYATMLEARRHLLEMKVRVKQNFARETNKGAPSDMLVSSHT